LRRAAITATFTEALVQTLSGNAADRQKCDQALTLARQIGEPTVLSESLLAMAQLQLRARDAAGALKSSLESQQIFGRFGNEEGEWLSWLVAAMACRSLGDAEKMHDYAERSQKALGEIQQPWGNENYNSYLNRPDIKLLHTQLPQLLAGKP
jgi:hypothetical protein